MLLLYILFCPAAVHQADQTGPQSTPAARDLEAVTEGLAALPPNLGADDAPHLSDAGPSTAAASAAQAAAAVGVAAGASDAQAGECSQFTLQRSDKLNRQPAACNSRAWTLAITADMPPACSLVDGATAFQLKLG